MRGNLMSDLFEAVGRGAAIALVAMLVLRAFGHVTGLCG